MGAGGGGSGAAPLPPGVFARPDVGGARPERSLGAVAVWVGAAALSSEGLEVFESETLGLLLM